MIKVCPYVWPALKCENSAIFMQNYSQKLFIAFKIAYSWCFSFRGNLAFRNFLQKSFITSSSGPKVVGGNLESHDDYFSHTPDMNRQEWIKRVDGAARSAANEKERKREKTLINRQRVFYWFAWYNKCPILWTLYDCKIRL